MVGRFKTGDKLVADKVAIDWGWGPIKRVGIIFVLDYFEFHNEMYYKVRYKCSKTRLTTEDWLPFRIQDHFRLANKTENTLYD